MNLDAYASQAWHAFLRNEENLGHIQRGAGYDDVPSYVAACWQGAQNTARRISDSWVGPEPRVILEVGASAGLICLAMQEIWREATIVALEPEIEAIAAGESLVPTLLDFRSRTVFVNGVGEAIPLMGQSVDLVVCHTVLEHVRSVPQVVSEMVRVLAPNGMLHLEAPNYAWPYEPHLRIWFVAALGKWFARLAARLQGRGQHIGFLNHLNFVTARGLQGIMTSLDLTYQDLSGTKLRRVLRGDADGVIAHTLVARLVSIIGKVGLGSVVMTAYNLFPMAPSLSYIVRKNNSES